MSIALWNSMNKLEIINVFEDFYPISKIKELEGRNAKDVEGGKGKKTSYP